MFDIYLAVAFDVRAAVHCSGMLSASGCSVMQLQIFKLDRKRLVWLQLHSSWLSKTMWMTSQVVSMFSI